tara:strand:- start:12094 stop:12390 length:297 start_codon:yes stop_codon:yes gene_type:complete
MSIVKDIANSTIKAYLWTNTQVEPISNAFGMAMTMISGGNAAAGKLAKAGVEFNYKHGMGALQTWTAKKIYFKINGTQLEGYDVENKTAELKEVAPTA